MSEVLELNNELPLDTAAKRALIESELRKDPNRSDHKIAEAVGHRIDHKTVGAARKRLGIAYPLGNSPPTPTEQRHMLIEGAKDFNKLYPPGPSEVATAEEAVNDAIAKGVVSLAPDADVNGEDGFWFIPHQARIECSMTADGMVQVWQEGQHGVDDAERIHVAVNNSVALARRILWAAGFKSIGIFAYARGGGCVDLEDGDSPAEISETPGYGPVR
jgi:hypothetical protein